MKVVMTGGTGFVGTWIVKELLAKNHEVILLVRNKEKIMQELRDKVSIVPCCMEQYGEIPIEKFPYKKADAFIHFAWDGLTGMKRSNIELQLNNVKGTCDAVELADRLQCKRFVYAGSIMEYETKKFVGEGLQNPGMGNVYGTAKLAANYLAKILANQKEMDYINVIISNMYGTGEDSDRFLYSTLKKMLRNDPIALTKGTQLYDFIYASDGAEAVVMALEKGIKNENYYIGNTTQRPLREFVLEMYQVVNSSSELQFGQVPFHGQSLTYQEFDTHKMEKLGFCPKVSFEEGVQLTSRWILQQEEGAV